MEYAVIMAGGSGTRLWPLSRNNRPKQLLSVIGGKSLLQLSYERLLRVVPPERIFVCTSSAHGQMVMENLPRLPRENLLGEPQGRDTANAVGFAAAILRKQDPDAVCAVVTADHVIEPIADFEKSIRTAFDVVKQRPHDLVTFGIVPTYGHTGLGYIQRGDPLPQPGAFRVQAFREKPDRATADRYVESGRFYWNSGMFVWRCDTVLGELAEFLPESHKGLMQIAQAWGTPQQESVLTSIYAKLPKISVDYAVMEPTSQGRGKAHVAVVEMPVQWLDVGSWPALAETLEVDEHNNACSAPFSVFVDSDDNVIISQDGEHLVATIGVSDMIIVHTKDATLVCPKAESQRVKELVALVAQKYQQKFLEDQPMRTLAIDLGGRRVGLAISDSGGRFATPLAVLRVQSPAEAHRQTRLAIDEHQPDRLLVGIPLNMDGTLGPAVTSTLAWARELASQTGLPLVLVDERLSSFEAEQQLIDRKRQGEHLTRKNKRDRLDALAAASFLQAFLDGHLPPLDLP